MTMLDLMNLQDQVEMDFAIARGRARLGRLMALLLRRDVRSTLLSSDEARRSVPARGAMFRGTRTIEVSKIVGSVGKHEQFDANFMPLSGVSPQRWMRIDRAFHRDQLTPVSLLKLGEGYFVIDGNHRVSVSRFHGVEWIDAEVTECKSLVDLRRTTTSAGETGREQAR